MDPLNVIDGCAGISRSDFSCQLFANEPDVIPTKRFCEITGVSSKTVLRLIKNRELPGFKMGRAYFVPKPALIDYVLGGGGLDDVS